MSAKGFRLSIAVLAVILVGIMIWSFLAELPLWVPALAMLVAVSGKAFMRRKTVDTLTDERQTMLGNRAGVITYRILTMTMALAGIVCIWLKDSLPDDFEIIGITLAFAASAMLVVYVISYIYLFARS